MKEYFKWDDRKAAEFSRWVIGKLTQPKSPEQLVEEFKEFKQPKKDWEIVKETTDCTTTPYTKTIISVKRLLDGEVFSINGNVCVVGGQVEYKISNFILCDNNISVSIFENKSTQLSLGAIYKPKQPLFTTFDNVPIYEGDEYWVVYNDWSISNCYGGSKLRFEYMNTFSTYHLAYEFKLMNKPCLSVNDIYKLAKTWFLTEGAEEDRFGMLHQKDLKQLAKQKIQNNHE